MNILNSTNLDITKSTNRLGPKICDQFVLASISTGQSYQVQGFTDRLNHRRKQNTVNPELDPTVVKNFEKSIERIRNLGCQVVHVDMSKASFSINCSSVLID